MDTNGMDVRTEQLLQLILQLSEPEQLLLVERVIALMRVRAQGDGSQNGQARSLLDLRGLGQELWEGVDAQIYVSEERDSLRQ
jgi:hypothetical protein